MPEHITAEEENTAIEGVVLQAEFDAEVARIRNAAGVGSAQEVSDAEAKASACVAEAVTRGLCEPGGSLLPPEQVNELHEANLKSVEAEVTKQRFLSDAGQENRLADEEQRLIALEAYVQGVWGSRRGATRA